MCPRELGEGLNLTLSVSKEVFFGGGEGEVLQFLDLCGSKQDTLI